jgi:hypothetical protein
MTPDPSQWFQRSEAFLKYYSSTSTKAYAKDHIKTAHIGATARRRSLSKAEPQDKNGSVQ